MMDAKIFDPLDERDVNDWLAEAPRKEILSLKLFDTALGGRERRVALVFFREVMRADGGGSAAERAGDRWRVG